MSIVSASPSPVRSKSRKQITRTVRLDLPVSRCSQGVVTVIAGKHRATYFLTRLDAEFGQGWQLEKIGSKRDKKYAVNLAESASHSTCECLGFLRHGSCRHVNALLALRQAGKLGQEATEAAQEPKPNAGRGAGQAIQTRVELELAPTEPPAKPRFRSAGDMAANDPEAYAEVNDLPSDVAWSRSTERQLASNLRNASSTAS